jgi:hypothetical protein
MSNHTPGPWEATLYLSETDPPMKYPRVWANGMLICSIPAAARFDYANAKLIAAAPDLLEACKGMVIAATRTIDHETFVEALEDIEKAIAKAEGRDDV